jgi:putative ABC transport system permease protein
MTEDFRYALKHAVRNPAFSLSVISVLTIGIAATTTVFSAVDAVFFRQLPFVHPEDIVAISEVEVPWRSAVTETSRPKERLDYTDLQSLPNVFKRVGAYAPGALNLTGAVSPMRVAVTMASPSFFQILGPTPLLGRAFTEDEGQYGGPATAILSQGLWQRAFASDPLIVGKKIRLNGFPHTIVGVMPTAFVFPSRTQIWIPLVIPFALEGAAAEAFRMTLPTRVIARLAPAVSPSLAQLRLRSAFRAQQDAMTVAPLRQALMPQRPMALPILLATTSLFLLIGCANVINLLIVQASTRNAEHILRATLGASPWHLARQALAETLFLAGVSGLTAIAVAQLAVRGLGLLIPTSLQEIVPIQIDGRVVLFAIAATSLTAILCGLLAAQRASAAATRIASTATGVVRSDRTLRARSVVVSAEIACATVLLIAATLTIRSFKAIMDIDTGLNSDHVGTIEVALDRTTHRTPASRALFFSQALARLSEDPAISLAAVVSELPLHGSLGVGLPCIHAEGKSEDVNDQICVQQIGVSPRYLEVMGMRLVAGRFPAELDSGEPVAVVNKMVARHLWADREAVGAQFILGSRFGQPKLIKVIGVIADVRTKSIAEAAIPQIYVPVTDFGLSAAIVAKGKVSDGLLMAQLNRAVRQVDPQQADLGAHMLNDAIASTIAPRRLQTLVMGACGLLAFLLATVGVYAVVAYDASLRTREIGIRRALGAKDNDLVLMMGRRSVVITLLGLLAGTLGSLAVTRYLSSQLFGIASTDVPSFSVAVGLMGLAALLAAFFPVLRAIRISPTAAMQDT